MGPCVGVLVQEETQSLYLPVYKWEGHHSFVAIATSALLLCSAGGSDSFYKVFLCEIT